MTSKCRDTDKAESRIEVVGGQYNASFCVVVLRFELLVAKPAHGLLLVAKPVIRRVNPLQSRLTGFKAGQVANWVVT